ncbi:MAG: hypothetical protein LBG65_05730 [Puniceicoccales bacterium]|jgi:thiosulfate dehydrogenase [quinone] large subunit|nr:hypothetical protein [Puniceicoccales bacterium]
MSEKKSNDTNNVGANDADSCSCSRDGNCGCPSSCGCGCQDGGDKCCSLCPGGKTAAFWVLRLWLGFRAFFTGLTKFHREEVAQVATGAAGEEYGSAAANAAAGAAQAAGAAGDAVKTQLVHHGLPQDGSWTLAAFKNADIWYMPPWALNIFENTLGYVLVALGVTLLLGIGTRISLFIQGLLYSGLTLGFIAITQEPGSSAGITMLGVHILLVVVALLLAKHNKLAVLKKF